MTNFDFHSDIFRFEDSSDINATFSYLTESVTSCHSTIGSSRRSSEVSFAGSSSSISRLTPTSPISAVPCFDDHLAPNSNLTGDFPSARLPFFENEVASLEPSDSLRSDQCMIPPAISYASCFIDGSTVPCEHSGSGLGIYSTDAADVRILGADLPIDVGLGQLIPYPNEIGAVLPDELMMSYLHPPFIIPSQTLRNMDSQGESITDPSPAGSPMARKPFCEPYHETENAVVVPAGYKPSDTIVSSEMVGTRSPQKSHRTRNRPASDKHLQQNVDARFTLSAFKEARATQKKKYKCSLCAKGFDRQEHYKRHQLSESHREMIAKSEKTEKKPPAKIYSCKACAKKFNRHDNLKPHIKTHLSTVGKSSRNTTVTIEQSWKYGWEDLDPRISNDEVVRGRRERSKRLAGG